MTSEKRAANAVGGKTARPCDSCLCKRARWYCAADDAFLCQSCDSSVHSANPLARRHERLSLKTANSSLRPERAEKADRTDAIPAWLSGFRRKARTPRHAKPIAKAEPVQAPLLVPDLSSGDDPSIVDEEQLLYRVPIFDPIDAAIIPSVNSTPVSDIESKPSVPPDGGVAEIAATADYMADFGTCDAELAVDVESLFGKGLEGEDFCMEALGLMESGGEGGEMDWSVKVEEVEDARMDGCHVDVDLDLSSHTLEMKFGYESPTTAAMACEEEEAMADVKKENKIFLRLNYEAIITEWASQGSPWTTGDRPNFNPDDCWPDWTRGCGTDHMQYDIGGQLMVGDRGREARVSRYREKRRSRLFSKKIRYEVRKLNAEKRPRMKGRFVKRASLAGPTTAFPF